MEVASPKIRKGYKQTEVGVIPEDWQSEYLENLCIPSGLVRGPFGGALKKEYFISKGYKVYEQKNAISGNINIGNYYIDAKKFEELRRFEVSEGDFIVSCSGTIGRIYQIPKKYEKGIINQALLKISINLNLFSGEYFGHYFAWSKFQKNIIEGTQGGAMKNLVGMSEFRKSLLALPESKDEQEAIATTLTDTDSLIQSLDALIEKKKNIKTATMQQLLSGKTRLAGFKGEWKTVPVGTVVDFAHGRGLPKSDIHEGAESKCIHYGQLFTEYGEKVGEIRSRTGTTDNVFLSKSNDVLLPTSDVTPRGLATASCIKEDGVILGGGILVLRPNADIDGCFISYFITNNKNTVLKLVKGSTVFHLYAKDLSQLEVYMPPTVEEQTAIVAVLEEMNLEINLLKKRRDKLISLKQGIMHELLTGNTRLV